jgi:DNA-directed RNA polymerase subunit RPC12/RpoP
MSIKFRCSDCGRKVSVNDVFAGGMCRCPSCRAFVFAPGEPIGMTVGRRPDVPPDPAEGTPRVSRSRPLRLSGAIAIAAALLVVALAVVVLIHYYRGR